MTRCAACGQSLPAALEAESWSDRAFAFVGEQLRITPTQLKSARRPCRLVTARQVFIWVMVTYRPDLTDHSIGKLLGNRNAKTVWHHRNMLPGLRARNPGFNELCQRFAARHPLPQEETYHGNTRH